MNTFGTPTLKPQKEEHWRTFLYALIVATAFFLPYIIMDEGYFLFYGDFNVQQVPFYQMCHRMVRSGDIFWNWYTDLGVNFIGSYSFYLLGSPFFWITIPFPNWMIPYLMGPLLILKFALSAFTAYFYIRRFTYSPKTATLCSLLYAFSGFSVYNIFFNHFHEAIIFFPLLLLAVEQFITENRKGVVALAVFICAVSNYFFFTGMVVFVFIYWFVRMLSNCWRLTFGKFLLLGFECVLGVLLGAAILLPSFYSVIQNPRVDNISYGWNAIMYGKEQIYLNIIEVFFFPPDLPARPVFFPNADVKWASLGGWLPVFSMTGVFAWMQSKTGHWLRRLIGILILMAMVPILNSAFYMFNSAYYARWFYMPVLMMCLATAMAIEDRSVNWNRAFNWTAGITAAFVLVIGLFPAEVKNGKITRYGIYSYDSNNPTLYLSRFLIASIIAVAGLIILKLILPSIRKNKPAFFRLSICSVCILSVIYATYFVGTGKTHSDSVKEMLIPKYLQSEVELPGDPQNYRIDVYSSIDNTGMFLKAPCINSFHSIVPKSIMDFYKFVGEERGVASRPTTKSYAIRPLLSVKYLLNPIRSDPVDDQRNSFSNNGKPRMPGFYYVGTNGGFRVYENDNYIPYGFTYDYYITRKQCESLSEADRANTMLKAIVLDEEQAERHKDILKNLADYYNIDLDDIKSISELPNLSFDDETLSQDCKARAATAAYSFTRDNHGFTAKIKLDRENLVFFSVPYEEGWSATVNGQPAKIEQVNIGFMAVRAPAGDVEIRFDYTTPGLANGIKLTILGALVFAAYLILCYLYKRRWPEKCLPVNPEREELMRKWEKYEQEDSRAALEEAMQAQLYDGYDSFVIKDIPEEGFIQGFNINIDPDSPETPEPGQGKSEAPGGHNPFENPGQDDL
ncbi:MAG TPA: YfhO family protein [Clostridiales bacterium]|nr:YfhO family protein [Clostridiales bacterium]